MVCVDRCGFVARCRSCVGHSKQPPANCVLIAYEELSVLLPTKNTVCVRLRLENICALRVFSSV